jgi:hypothetical protein
MVGLKSMKKIAFAAHFKDLSPQANNALNCHWWCHRIRHRRFLKTHPVC